MRYVRYQDYRHNPRRPISLLDRVVEKYERARFTFTESQALHDLWQSGEDIRLREDSRFLEIENTGHFQLTQHRLANEILADKLWQGTWDGGDIEAELQRLDESASGSFHIFCRADARFIEADGKMILTTRPKLSIPETIRTIFDSLAEKLLSLHLESGRPLNTIELLKLIQRLGNPPDAPDQILEYLESWLAEQREWTEVARGLWLPTVLLPQTPDPKPVRVIQIGATGAGLHQTTVVILPDDSKPNAQNSGCDSPEPGSKAPAARAADGTVSWAQILKTIHIQGKYLPVPHRARFRYPRFVGLDGPLALRCLSVDSGREGWLWLDRQRHRFFGDFLYELIEWEEAGRSLRITWRPEAVSIKLGDVDLNTQEEERRHIDPEALHELRNGRGESYRVSLIEILQENPQGLPLTELYQRLAARQGHFPSRASVRAILCQSPEFIFEDRCWKWQFTPQAERVFREKMVILNFVSETGSAPKNLIELSTAIRQNLLKLLQ
jgi:hypothetical protein